MEAFRILIVDDHDAVRRGVRSLLSSRRDWSVCGEAIDGLEAIEKAKELRPDAVLMDISMPRMNGIEATRIIRREVPECQVIMVSQNDPSALARQVAEVDARAYVLKADIARDLFPALEKVLGRKSGNGHSAPAPEDTGASSDNSLCGGGTLGQLIREHDWSATPLGPIHNWPQSLKTAVNLMLNSQHPMWIGWGEEMIFLYNDAYISVLSQAKHPASLGRRADEVWAEIWDVCGPLAERVFSKGEPSFLHDVRLFMNRGDYLEETYYSFSYSPIYDDCGKVAGLFCPSSESTPRVLNARRLKTLAELSANALVEKSVPAACASGLATLGQNPDDIPFALLYLLAEDGKSVRLQAISRLPGEMTNIIPEEISLSAGSGHAQFWRINEVVDTVQAQVVSVKELEQLPLGPALQPVAEAIVLPVTSRGQDRPVAVLIAGINPNRPLDVEYRTFFALVADQVATAIQNARAVEEERRRADTLAEIDRAKTLFFSNVSHEFRTPLTLMLGPLEDALADATSLPEVQRERLEVAHRNSVRLLKLVNTLLDFSRIESGRTQATYEPVDLAAYTAELGSVFRSAIEGAGLRFIIHCENIGEPAYIDREMWEKIVFNLLSNAFKFTFEGEIELALRKIDGSAVLSVRDAGIGVPAKDLPHLFERFHRVKGARGRSFEGSGIGLALVQELAKLHGGAVHAESKMGEGSTFTVAIPLGKAHLPAERIGPARQAHPSAIAAGYVEEARYWSGASEILPDTFPAAASEQTRVGPRPRVLLADDNADMREYLRKLLASRYEVETVSDGRAAIEAARKNRPDLVLTDVMMPELDGFAVLRALRDDASTATVPVILLSARAGEESRVKGLAAGADDYLVKPFSARELLARVDTHVNLAHLRREADQRVRHSEEELRILHRVGGTLASELELKKVVQAATDAGRELSGAQFGAFFYNVTDDEGQKLLLFTLSGAPLEAFEKFGLPRNTSIFGPTFRGEPTVRLEDVTKDARYGKNAPHYGMPPGHPPVRSYLATPVFSRSGEVVGGLFYGHPEAGVFTERAERLVEGIARHAAIAIDNARLFQESQRTQAEAQAAAERLRAIFNSAAVGVSILSKDARFLEVNKAFCEMTGYSQEELLERDCEAITHPEDRAQVRERLAQMMSGEFPGFVLEVRYVRKGGETIWVQKSISLVHDAAGKPLNIIALSQEITRRKKAEKATGFLAAIVESSEDAIVTKDLNGIITSWNKGAERIFGYTAEEAVGRSITLIIPPDRLHEEDRILAQIRRGQRVEHFDTVRMRKDGTLLDISPTISPVRDASGRVVGASKVARDITERKQAERTLAEQARRQRALFQLADQSHRAESLENVYDAAFQALSTGLQCERAAILLLDPQGVMRFISWRGLSDGYRKAVEGHSPWKATQKNPQPVCVPDVQSSDLAGALKATVAAEGIAALAFIPLVSNSRLMGKFMAYYDAPHVFAEEEISFSLAVAHQLAFGIDRRRSEEALRESEERYRRLAQSLDAEVQLRTSELEQRTADVMRQAEQLRDLSGRLMRLQDDERRHIARELHDSAGQTLTVLGLTLARVKQQAKQRDPQLAGEVEGCEEFAQQLMREIRTTSYLLHPPLLDESGLSAALNWYMQGLAERSGLDLTLTIAEDFGRLPDDLEVAVFRLVQECLTNVHRHSGSKSAVIRITREPDIVRVEVQDHGKGIPPERLSQIQSRASGVGIRGMRERVRQFQGTMEIQSDKKGTRVLVEIPIAANQLSDEEEGPELEAAV